ncbi:hypothetical protein CLOSTHATH_06003 [Hungatella hathewayi DSM 13479]|uniref:Uncharacterized protein n=1 Tax=Hungatella hathewayi DSM 13479 TaxID=566550 RepID=D3AQU7_9FIRM|nr:hypothetical protein CLOSTHATH_06003 [Hungatella hathewayi DSM 13479]
MAQTGPPTTGKSLPKNQAGTEMARQIRSPAVYFFIDNNSFPVCYDHDIMGIKFLAMETVTIIQKDNH